MIEGLVVRRHEGGDWCAHALLQRVLAETQDLEETTPVESGYPRVPEAVTGHFVAGVVNAADLVGIVVWPGAAERGSTNDRKARGNLEFGVQLQEAIRVLELQMAGPKRDGEAACYVGVHP